MSASFSPRPHRPVQSATMPAGSPSTWRKGVARHVREKVSCASNSSFCRACTRPVRLVKAPRYNAKTLEIKVREKSIADVLAMTVDEAFEFFRDDNLLARSLGVL